MLKKLQEQIIIVAETPLIRYFYGVVGSGKTEKLLHDSLDNGESTIYVLPEQSSKGVIESRKCNFDDDNQLRIVITPDIIFGEHYQKDRAKLFDLIYKDYHEVGRVVIDDAHFLTPDDIYSIAEACRDTTTKLDTYGLLTSFHGEMFRSSRELIDQADESIYLSHQCELFGCFDEATYNCLLKQPTPPASDIFVDGDYTSLCPTHKKIFAEEGLIEE